MRTISIVCSFSMGKFMENIVALIVYLYFLHQVLTKISLNYVQTSRTFNHTPSYPGMHFYKKILWWSKWSVGYVDYLTTPVLAHNRLCPYMRQDNYSVALFIRTTWHMYPSVNCIIVVSNNSRLQLHSVIKCNGASLSIWWTNFSDICIKAHELFYNFRELQHVVWKITISLPRPQCIKTHVGCHLWSKVFVDNNYSRHAFQSCYLQEFVR